MFRYSKLLFVLTLLALPAFLRAQDDEPAQKPAKKPLTSSFADRLVYAGNVGLTFGNVTSISVSPMVGYKVTDKFIPGVGVTYNYLRFNYPGYRSEAIHIYGGSLWARYYVFDNVFLHGEYEALNGEWDPYVRPDYRYYLNSLLVGGGYTQNFGGLSSYILVLYNLTYSQDSPYASPFVFRVGFGFGM